MTTNPFFNATLVAGYIGSLVFLITNLARPNTAAESMLVPVVMLSLFVLSAAVMGFLFLYKPLQLYFDGKKQEATSFFLNTVLIFAAITAVLVAALFVAL